MLSRAYSVPGTNSKCFTEIISCNSHNNSMRHTLISILQISIERIRPTEVVRMDVLKSTFNSKSYHSWFHLLSAPKAALCQSLLRGLPTSLKYIKASASCKDEVRVIQQQENKASKINLPASRHWAHHTWASQSPSLLSHCKPISGYQR